MINIEPGLLPHLIAAVCAEIERLHAISQKDEPEWPDDYDGNDEWIYHGILKELLLREQSKTGAVNIRSQKYMQFLAILIPPHVAANDGALSLSEREGLESIYRQLTLHWHREPGRPVLR